MIRSFRHKGLKRLYKQDDPRGVTTEHAEKLRDIFWRALMLQVWLLIWTCPAFVYIRSRAAI